MSVRPSIHLSHMGTRELFSEVYWNLLLGSFTNGLRVECFSFVWSGITTTNTLHEKLNAFISSEVTLGIPPPGTTTTGPRGISLWYYHPDRHSATQRSLTPDNSGVNDGILKRRKSYRDGKTSSHKLDFRFSRRRQDNSLVGKAPCILVEVELRFRRVYLWNIGMFLRAYTALQVWCRLTFRRFLPLKRRSTSVRLHGAVSQKAVIFSLTYLRYFHTVD
jgi:hypothetical protein